jgi:hypothetical protein
MRYGVSVKGKTHNLTPEKLNTKRQLLPVKLGPHHE